MKTAALLNSGILFLEIGPHSLKARIGAENIEMLLEHQADGRLAPKNKASVIAALKDFLKAKSWLPRQRAWCAIGSRCMSLRRLSLPGGTKEEFQQRLLLQIEAEFPLPPDELAWGCQTLGPSQAGNGAPLRQDLLVAAVKKEVVAEYHEILRACGTEPVFIPAAMARQQLCAQPGNAFAVLDLGTAQAELTLFEGGVPTISRIIYWNGKGMAITNSTELERLAASIKAHSSGPKLFVSGNGVSKEFADRLTFALGNGCKCQPLDIGLANGTSAAMAGLEKLASDHANPPLAIRLDPVATTSPKSGSLEWKTWGARIGALAAAFLLLPYAEALLLKPHLESTVETFKHDAERLKLIDRELDFLQTLKLSQPPYLDLLSVFSKAAPQGTRFDALSLNSHGVVTWRCSFRDGQQVADFRSKLIASGFFATVVEEEQTPTPDRQKVNVRMSAQEKSGAELQLASARLAAEDAKNKQATTNSVSSATNSMPSISKKDSP